MDYVGQQLSGRELSAIGLNNLQVSYSRVFFATFGGNDRPKMACASGDCHWKITYVAENIDRD